MCLFLQPFAWLTARLPARWLAYRPVNPTQNTRPAAVGGSGGRVIGLFCPLKIVGPCQLKSGAQFLCLGALPLPSQQHASLFPATSPVGTEPALTRECTDFWQLIHYRDAKLLI